MNGDEAVKRICDQFVEEGTDPLAATSLTFVTWEELIRTVVTEAGRAGVWPIEWPAG